MSEQEMVELENKERALYEKVKSTKHAADKALEEWSPVYNQIEREKTMAKLRAEILAENKQ